MIESSFGTILRRLREARGLSLREVGQLSGFDHAYVHRLETGEKESPSEDAVAQIVRALRPSKRQERVLRFLIGRDVAPDLLDPAIIDDPDIDLDDFESAAQMSFRGKKPSGPAEWRSAIDKIRKLRKEFEGG